jgi:hypothetical protein
MLIKFRDPLNILLTLMLAVAIAGLAAGEATAKRVQGGKKQAACDKELGSDIAGCSKMLSHMVQGLPQSVYDDAIRQCENDAAKRYDQCLTVRQFDNIPDIQAVPQ